MLSYQAVKFLHIVSVMILLSFSTMCLLTKSSRGVMIMYGIGGLGAVVFGLFLIGILGQGMPGWMHAKLGIWLAIMAMVGIVNKRFPKYKVHATYALFALAALAVYFAVYKPGA